MSEAVDISLASAQPDDVVLLAPACASFDMFPGFEERGRVFKSEVNRVLERNAKEAGLTAV
jgi:UDP-N-acetylmuramoylalanine--D-glutamate ligase